MRIIQALLFAACLIMSGSVSAQHTKHEIAFSLAYGAQFPIVKDAGNTQGFFAAPLIASLRYQVATDYLQSLSVTLEHFTESRNHTDLWNDNPSAMTKEYNASIDERLSMTVLGLEGVRTLMSESNFRLGGGFGFGYGLGGAKAVVKKIADGTMKIFESADIWNGFEVQAFLRGVYTLIKTDKTDIGVSASVRYWGFPSFGPLSTTSSSYNGPALRSLHEFGYMIGIAVGFQ